MVWGWLGVGGGGGVGSGGWSGWGGQVRMWCMVMVIGCFGLEVLIAGMRARVGWI